MEWIMIGLITCGLSLLVGAKLSMAFIWFITGVLGLTSLSAAMMLLMIRKSDTKSSGAIGAFFIMALVILLCVCVLGPMWLGVWIFK